MANFSSKLYENITEAGMATANAVDMPERTEKVHEAYVSLETDVSVGKQVPEQHKQKAGQSDTDFRLNFTDESLLNGIILAEVLGKPKYFRKGRWS